MTSRYRILVADMTEFSAGWLHGKWVDVMAEDIQEHIEQILLSSHTKDATEWIICDYDGFGDLDMPACTSIEWVKEIAAFLGEYPDIGEVLLEHFELSLENAKIAAVDQDQGIHNSVSDYIKAVVDDVDAIPEHYKPYIDYERMARDMEDNGNILCIRANGKCYAFLPFQPVE